MLVSTSSGGRRSRHVGACRKGFPTRVGMVRSHRWSSQPLSPPRSPLLGADISCANQADISCANDKYLSFLLHYVPNL